VISFNCGTEPDTAIVVLNGRIVEKIQSGEGDTLIPLPAAVISLENGRTNITADSAGHFLVYLAPKAAHPFVVSKDGYQPLKVEGFFADKETLAEIKIVLERGRTERHGRVTPCKIAY
jgi:hypothetical protein